MMMMIFLRFSLRLSQKEFRFCEYFRLQRAFTNIEMKRWDDRLHDGVERHHVSTQTQHIGQMLAFANAPVQSDRSIDRRLGNPNLCKH